MIYLPLKRSPVKVKKLAREHSEAPVMNGMQAEAKEVIVGSVESVLARAPLTSRGPRVLSGGCRSHALPALGNPTRKIVTGSVCKGQTGSKLLIHVLSWAACHQLDSKT